MSMSDYLEKKVMDHVFGKAAFGARSNLFVALFTVAPSDAGGGTEATGGGYARVSTAPAGWSAATGTDATVTNTAVISFPTATTGGYSAGANLVGFALYDAATAGNLMFYGPLGIAKGVAEGDTPEFAASSLSFKFNG